MIWYWLENRNTLGLSYWLPLNGSNGLQALECLCFQWNVVFIWKGGLFRICFLNKLGSKFVFANKSKITKLFGGKQTSKMSFWLIFFGPPLGIRVRPKDPNPRQKGAFFVPYKRLANYEVKYFNIEVSSDGWIFFFV